jgi:uncharacterized delta-60 repeat protein/uncharacterized repeat protein (TIGR01451 family)
VGSAALLLSLLAGNGEAGTVSYQEGDGKGVVSQTDDTTLDETAPDTTWVGAGQDVTQMEVGLSPHRHSVLNFPNIFGGGVDQIPPGSAIISATLTLVVNNDGTDCPIVYQLTEDWTEAEATWNSRASASSWSAPGADGAGSHTGVVEGIMPCTGAVSPVNMDVTRSVQSWSNGRLNAGWVFVNDSNNDDLSYRTSEHATAADRPMLTVTFVPTVFYSVGTNPGNLRMGSPTISITGSTAALSIPQTANVGVGDVIDYDTPSQLVYISAVTSPTQFQVQKADGSAPGPTAGATVNSIRRVFNSIDDAESQSDDASYLTTGDLAGTFRRLTWVLYDDGPFREDVRINGYSTAPDYHVTVTVAGAFQVASGVSQRHRGTAGTGAVLKPQTGSALETRDDYVVIEWLEIDGSEAAGPNRWGVDVSSSGGNILVQNVLVHDFTGSGSGGLRGAVAGASFRNCVVYDSQVGVEFETEDTMTALNCTIYNSIEDGLRANGSTGHVVQNVISMGSGGDDFSALGGGGFAVFDNNLSSDPTAGAFGGSGNQVSQPPAGEFVSLVSPLNLHLRPGAAAIDAGTDLSASFNKDIDGQIRPQSLTWDVGADESPLSSTVTNYRSIGIAAPYGAGQVDVTTLSDVVTGVTTTWLASNRGRGDVITIPCDTPPACPLGTDYTVLAVDSDTSLRLTEAYTGPTASGVSYLIRRQFATLEEWEDCISGGGPCLFFSVGGNDLVADDRSEEGIAYRDGAFVPAVPVIFEATTTDASHTIKLTANRRNRHNGVPGAGVIVDGQDNPNGLLVRIGHVTVEWLEFVRVRGADDQSAVRIDDSGATNVSLRNLLIHDFYDNGNRVSGIRLSGTGPKSVTVRNTMIWDGDEFGIEGDELTDVLVIESCSIHDMRDNPGVGIYADQSTVTVSNTIVTRSIPSLDFDEGTGAFVGSNNISSDLTAPGAIPLTSVAAASVFAFIDPGPTHDHDLHLLAGGNPARDSGVNLFPTSGFRDDVDGELRPVGPQWDRGADEFSPRTPDLAIAKDDGLAVAVPGTPLSYAITVTNNGPDPVPSVTVTDPVPAALLGASFFTSNGTYNNGTGVWNFASPLFVGESAVLTLSGTIDPAATGTLTNTATVAPPPGFADPFPGNDTASDVDTLTPEADLEMLKSDNGDPIDIGNFLVYTLTVTNHGPSDATGVVVTDTFVSELEYQSATWSQGVCNYDGPTRTLTCNLGVVASGTSPTIVVVVRPLALGTFVNTASVGGIEPDPAPGNNSATELTTVGASQSCVVTTDLEGGDDWGTGVALQSDGRIVVGGFGYRPGPGDQDFAALRYTPGLQLDGGFGVGGKTATEIEGNDQAHAMALLSNGRILLGGHDRVAHGVLDDDFTLVRYNPDGSLDTSFNPTGTFGNFPNLPGIVTTQVDTEWDLGRAVAVQVDGKFLLAGAVQVGGVAGTRDLGLVRYLPDGDLDPSFGTGGKVTTAIGVDDDWATSIALQPDGKIVVGGALWNGTDWDWVIARYDPDGSLDGSFGAGGVVVADHGIDDWTEAVAVQPDGKIVLIGQSNAGSDVDFAVARYNPDGTLDTASFNPASTFGDPPNQPGMVFARIGTGHDLIAAGALQPDGRILAVGWSDNGLNDDFAMVRFNSDGSLDGAFGTGGKVTTAIGGDGDEARAVALQPDGRILVAGRSYNVGTANWDFALARYTSSGRLDAGCGTARYRSIGTAVNLVDEGTITVTAGSSTVTKVGGLGWLAENRGRGDVLVVGPDTYTIIDVVSDDELTLASVPATGYTGGTYTIARQFRGAGVADQALRDWETCISGGGGCVYFPVASANLISDNRSEVGIAYNDSVFAMTAKLTIDGSTTDALHTITLTADRGNRHNGTPGAGVLIDAQDSPFGIDVEDDHVTLEWLEIIRFRGVDNGGETGPRACSCRTFSSTTSSTRPTTSRGSASREWACRTSPSETP